MHNINMGAGIFKSDAFSKGFGRNLRRLRTQSKMTIEALGGKAGLDPTHLSRIERGESAANTRIIPKLTKALKVTPNDLFKGLG